jgi:hypothetical protein
MQLKSFFVRKFSSVSIFFVNGQQFSLAIDSSKYSILQACEEVGVFIPRFCYHEELSIAGNCRMCLVELAKSPKPVASCAMPFSQNMSVFTETTMVKLAREGVLEFLLLNHPLDCPVCDQGGECDLQDQAFVFGNDKGRFFDQKKTSTNKYIGPLIKTIMTRCIHCTRCVRFVDDVLATSFLGTTGRGFNMEIGSYYSNFKYSPLSGNLVDLCPVGALTTKKTQFLLRSWELNSAQRTDAMDCLGQQLRFDFRGNDFMRVLPLAEKSPLGPWIHDRSRFAYDAFFNQRLNDFFFFNKRKQKILLGFTQAAIFFLEKTEAVFFFSGNWFCKMSGFFLANKLNTNVFVDDSLTISAAIAVKDFCSFFGLVHINCASEPLKNVDFASTFRVCKGVFSNKSLESFFFVATNPMITMPIFLFSWLKKSKFFKIFPTIFSGPISDIEFSNQSGFKSHGLTDFCSFLSGRGRFSKDCLFLTNTHIVSSIFFVNAFDILAQNQFFKGFFGTKSGFLPECSQIGILSGSEIGLFSKKYNFFSKTTNNLSILDLMFGSFFANAGSSVFSALFSTHVYSTPNFNFKKEFDFYFGVSCSFENISFYSLSVFGVLTCSFSNFKFASRSASLEYIVYNFFTIYPNINSENKANTFLSRLQLSSKEQNIVFTKVLTFPQIFFYIWPVFYTDIFKLFCKNISFSKFQNINFHSATMSEIHFCSASKYSSFF